MHAVKGIWLVLLNKATEPLPRLGTETILSLIMYEMFAVLWYLLEVIYSELISVNFARSAGKLSLLSFDFSMLRSFSLCVARSLWI